MRMAVLGTVLALIIHGRQRVISATNDLTVATAACKVHASINSSGCKSPRFRGLGFYSAPKKVDIPPRAHLKGRWGPLGVERWKAHFHDKAVV